MFFNLNQPPIYSQNNDLIFKNGAKNYLPIRRQYQGFDGLMFILEPDELLFLLEVVVDHYHTSSWVDDFRFREIMCIESA